MSAKYKVKLTPKQRQELLNLIRNGKDKAKKLMHARVLLEADASHAGPGLQAKEIAKRLHIHARTALRIKERFAKEGLEASLNRKPHQNYKPHRLDGEQESCLIALCCSKAPEGRAVWTLQLLGEYLVKLNIVDTISRSTIYRTLKKTSLSRG
jgi:transposase